MTKIEELKKIINESNNIVLFTGAGASTLSGIKDFRSKDGIYNMKYKYNPEEILSHHFFYSKTKDFYDFYKDKLNCINASPNIVHKYFYELEKQGKLKCVITQNIDGLHTKAGNKNVLEMHGTIYKNHCIKCNKFYDAEYVFNSKDIPICSCGGIIKPDVVLYEEALNQDDLINAEYYISSCETLIVVGTSLSVYPISGLIRLFRGKNLVILNRDTTSYDNIASLVINDELDNIFKKLND